MASSTWVSYWEMDLEWDVLRVRRADEKTSDGEIMMKILAGRHSKLAVWHRGDHFSVRVK